MLPVPQIRFDTILASKIIYDNDTRLFPFSPRLAIDERLVEQLKKSLIETGFWEPVVVRMETLEGIAGNHRFLAYLEMGRENGIEAERLEIPAALVDCGEGTAVSIALMENEVREDLTQLEAIRALLQTARRKPRLTQTVFEVDGKTVEQLKLWEKELLHTKLDKPRPSRNIPLTREWLTLVNTRLADYPDLRQHFLTQLKHLDWVQTHSLDALNRAITEALKRYGIQFQKDETWLPAPTEIST